MGYDAPTRAGTFLLNYYQEIPKGIS
jgi:hypothetical protein